MIYDSPAKILAAFLIGNAVFGDPEDSAPTWPLFIGYLPDAAEVPDSAAAIYDTQGLANSREIGPPFEHAVFYGIQVKVRAQEADDAWAQIAAVVALLGQVSGQTATVGATDYELQCVDQVSSPLFMGIESGTKRRCAYVVNFLCTINGGASSSPPINT